MKQYAVEFENITKDFVGIRANDDISFKVAKGTIHALIGENGAGKSTLMSILFGLYEQNEGKIKINGKEVFIKNPFEANDLGIGMVHQHFKLVDVYTNFENIIMGSEFETKFKTIDRKNAMQKIQALQNTYDLKFDLKQKVEDSTVAIQQKVEIMKMLYRDAEILIFDEPTAVLTDQEIQGLLKTMDRFRENGKTIIFISHKLKEIKQIADEATVLRLGKVASSFANLRNVHPKEMAEAMVGKDVQEAKNTSSVLSDKVFFEFKNISAQGNKKIEDVSFQIRSGEILAIAGVEGNGQEEIELVASGLLKPKKGNILKLNNGKIEDITKLSVKEKINNKISFIPGDRHKYGLVLDFTIEENSILRSLYRKKIAFFGLINRKLQKQKSNKIIKEFDVRGARGGLSNARSLSGGNQQKAIVGREMLNEHDVLIVVQPTRGLDVGAIKSIHEKIIEEKNSGKAILLISYELDEIMSLADTIMVINKGKVEDIKPKNKITREEIGLMMSGSQEKNESEKT